MCVNGFIGKPQPLAKDRAHSICGRISCLGLDPAPAHPDAPPLMSLLTPAKQSATRWHEVRTADGTPREIYAKLLRDLTELAPADVRALEDRMAATLREMGVTFDIIRNDPWGRRPWTCDLLPQIFLGEEWARIVRGFRQRLRAFEMFLADVYGPREILRAGVVPVQTVLGSPHYQSASIGLPRPRNAYLHLSGLCLARDAHGALQVKQQHFGHATGISYMLQNRRALARIAPEFFQDEPVQSLAESSLLILEQLREAAASFGGEPTVVLLSPGAGSAVSFEQSFLARRMGIPMVEGGDLLVLDDCVFLKTVRGLERVEVICNRVPDSYLDPLVFRRDSLLGVPGLVHCLRKGTVALVNSVGSQLADDRTLLAFSQQIIRFYLNESSVLPTVPTRWLGDIDQREEVLEKLDQWRIRPVVGDWRGDVASLRKQAPISESDPAFLAEVRKNPARFVAQPSEQGAATICFSNGRPVEFSQDHLVFAVRSGAEFSVLPGALTRVHSSTDAVGEFGAGWTSKDTWILPDENTAPLIPTIGHRVPDAHLPPRQVTSRAAESFYWMGRYLERAHHQAYLISVVETLETEELNSAERKHYRPMWNKLLPPIEKSSGTSRRSISNRIDRYRLVLLPEPGSVLTTYLRAISNAESVQDSLSPEAWATLNNLRSRLYRTPFREAVSELEAVRITRRVADFATQIIPQFFAIAANTMLADDAWRFCEIGRMLERAVITANSVLSISGTLTSSPAGNQMHSSEIELSAFLRLLGTRDAYRRIYQMRATPIHVLELQIQHPQVPRSLRHCLEKCRELLRASIAEETLASAKAPAAMDDLIREIRRIDWRNFVALPRDEDPAPDSAKAPRQPRPAELEPLLLQLLNRTRDLHTSIADSFLNHQARIAQVTQPLLSGL